jgi:hypothetical protein
MISASWWNDSVKGNLNARGKAVPVAHLHHHSHIDWPGTEDGPFSLSEQRFASTLHKAFVTCTGKTLPLVLLNGIYNGILCYYDMAHLAVAGGGDDFHIRVCAILINALRQPKRVVTLFMVGRRINTLHR